MVRLQVIFSFNLYCLPSCDPSFLYSVTVYNFLYKKSLGRKQLKNFLKSVFNAWLKRKTGAMVPSVGPLEVPESNSGQVLSKGPQDQPPWQREGSASLLSRKTSALSMRETVSCSEGPSQCQQDKGPQMWVKPLKSMASGPRASTPQLCSREHVRGGQGEVRAPGGSQFLFCLLVEQDVVLWTHAKALPDSIQVGFNVLSPNKHSPGCRWQQTSHDGPAKSRNQWQRAWPLGTP